MIQPRDYSQKIGSLFKKTIFLKKNPHHARLESIISQVLKVIRQDLEINFGTLELALRGFYAYSCLRVSQEVFSVISGAHRVLYLLTLAKTLLNKF